jgi:hypothetical protein
MKYFLLTLRHKWFVLLAGLKLKAPLHLLILHDWTKFTPMELPHYQRQFYGKADKPLNFSYAWLHHQRCNKHHWEYWIPITGHNRGGYPDGIALPMPEKYVREMVADWCGASRAYEGKWPDGNWAWWPKNKVKISQHCHPDTTKLISQLLREIYIEKVFGK